VQPRKETNMTRIALVTGGMGGIGTAICRELSSQGFQVVTTHSPGNSRVPEWLAAMERERHTCWAYPCDVADYESAQRCLRAIRQDIGEVDVLVNNAGVTHDATFRKMDKAGWDLVLRADLDSLFNMTKPVCDGMADRGWGRVINISSVNAQKGAFGQVNYAAAKAGMYGFTKALALEVARKGVTVNTVSPGYIATKMVTAVPQDILEGKILPQIPIGRLGQPQEVASLVAYLASDAAAFITGANIAINGGQHMC
jgi:acetoacetyl-CoA reductase